MSNPALQIKLPKFWPPMSAEKAVTIAALANRSIDAGPADSEIGRAVIFRGRPQSVTPGNRCELLSRFSRRLLKAIPIGEERIQLRCQVGIRRQEFFRVGILPALDRLQEGGDDFVGTLFAGRRFRRSCRQISPAAF